MLKPRERAASRPRGTGNAARPAAVRVAIYTRKSTAEGLDQELNSLEAQRQTVEAYIQSQRTHGWKALPQRYDDGGFTGANTARPSFQRLLADIEAGTVGCVAVYKIDRLSRSLSDFARIMDLFERHGVTFVSVTQQFSTATSVGKLTLNLLMSFAEFERDVISERTRDKIAACRRNGLWTGGRPVLGYDIEDKRLVVNEAEAATVWEIFAAYLERGSLLETARDLRRRGVRTKVFRSKRGRESAGLPFTKTSLQTLLTNPLYAGMVRAGSALVDGAHKAIVEQATWDAVQELLQRNRRCGAGPRRKWDAGLDRLLRCGACGQAMSHSYTTRAGRTNRYYVCQTQQNLGADACPGSRVSASAVEEHVFGKVEEAAAEHGLLETAVATEFERHRAEHESSRNGRKGHAGSVPFATVQPAWDQLGRSDRQQVLRPLIAGVTYTATTDEIDIEMRLMGFGNPEGVT
ncbi:MAG: recombinase family protein [Planctomycetes bacterium]|nr:recombinase family protein [Planctomycetota bacterium]